MENIKDLLEYEEQKRQENIIGKLFVQFLHETFIEKEIGELIEFCKLLVVLGAVV